MTTDRMSHTTMEPGREGRARPSRAARRRDAGVESNARLTAATGLLLLVMLAAEGFTILAIHPLL